MSVVANSEGNRSAGDVPPPAAGGQRAVGFGVFGDGSDFFGLAGRFGIRDGREHIGPHAARRDMHPNRLARLIVETVVDEKMVDAVLDDAEELAGANAPHPEPVEGRTPVTAMTFFTHRAFREWRGDIVCCGCGRSLVWLTRVSRWNRRHTAMHPVCADADLSFIGGRDG